MVMRDKWGKQIQRSTKDWKPHIIKKEISRIARKHGYGLARSSDLKINIRMHGETGMKVHLGSYIGIDTPGMFISYPKAEGIPTKTSCKAIIWDEFGTINLWEDMSKDKYYQILDEIKNMLESHGYDVTVDTTA